MSGTERECRWPELARRPAVAGLVSVVVPVFNGEKYLRQTVESVLAQTYQAIEVVAVDDGSTDSSPEILTGYGPPIRVIRQSNAGVGAARTRGAEESLGEFVCFLDQDDWWEPLKIAKQVACFRSDERIGLVHTDVAYFDSDREEFVPCPNPNARPQDLAGECYERLLLGNPICNSAVMVRRRDLIAAGAFDRRVAGNTVQDYEMWLRVSRSARLGFVADQATFFRLHSEQGHKDRRAMLNEELKVLLWHKSASAWRSSATGRRRMAQLLDELATAHFDAGDAAKARATFCQALRYSAAPRQWIRFAASCLPYFLARGGRDWVMSARKTWLPKRAAA